VNQTMTEARVASGSPAKAPGLLLVSSLDEDLIRLLRIISDAEWNIYWYTNRSDALASLQKNTISAVICDRELQDSDWRGLLYRLESMVKPPPLIVTTRLADDRFWAEVLNRGGYDVLMKPYAAEEVLRTIRSACASFESARGAAVRGSGASAA
jgi:DNA-binding response OmpR family regulator